MLIPMYGALAQVNVLAVELDRRILLEWSGYGITAGKLAPHLPKLMVKWGDKHETLPARL